jgi:hypothetical protein
LLCCPGGPWTPGFKWSSLFCFLGSWTSAVCHCAWVYCILLVLHCSSWWNHHKVSLTIS